VPIVHPLLAPATQPRLPLDQLLRVPHLHLLGIQANLDVLADQPARHRVTIPLHVNQAALVHATTSSLTRFQPPRRQGPQHGHLLRQPWTPPGVELFRQPVQKTAVRFPARKIPAAPQQQRLVHRLLEAPVPLLDVAILVRVVRLDLLADHPVMRQQTLIPLRELLLVRQVIHGRAQPIRPMPLRHSPQFPQRVLQSFAQALKTLGEADRHRLPVGVRQHEVINQVRERLPREGHLQLAHVREVRRCQTPRLMHLAKEHLLGRAHGRTPASNLALQRPQLAVGKPARVTTLQLAEYGLGLQPRVLVQQGAYLRPNLTERIDAGRPIVRPSQLAGQLLLPPILACRLVVHVRPRCRRSQRLARRQQTTQLPHLFVRDHRKPPCVRDLRIV
jgi:hypothetical protein